MLITAFVLSILSVIAFMYVSYTLEKSKDPHRFFKQEIQLLEISIIAGTLFF